MSNEIYDRGLVIRKEVVGADYVERSLAAADDFTRPLQELVTEYCWGVVWARDGIDRRMRSILNIGMLIALNRPHELALHIRGALNNGLTPDEIRELVLQSAIYCGVPAALDATRVAHKAIADYGQ
ncbi:carboxymuconolactone decarboxylase family protein [Sphingobium fuliginis]|uniref:4-carboxymuconolactone decarboxylase n=1 Tax=Sphingobium fuliginis ATCC 27551 TaxID=1208342 RepID=A0A5B8CF85_SPHSA|nr:carboxymuconolactone decarboxylase family protein [Sphingobium fuliginis]QDC38254.1 4-carboxymuconolactone decarboxylase [Sphingobium fuliginis ATCC 27551]